MRNLLYALLIGLLVTCVGCDSSVVVSGGLAFFAPTHQGYHCPAETGYQCISEIYGPSPFEMIVDTFETFE